MAATVFSFNLCSTDRREGVAEKIEELCFQNNGLMFSRDKKPEKRRLGEFRLPPWSRSLLERLVATQLQACVARKQEKPEQTGQWNVARGLRQFFRHRSSR